MGTRLVVLEWDYCDMGTRLVVLEWDCYDMGVGMLWYWNGTAVTLK